jgi:hypothetical protein
MMTQQYQMPMAFGQNDLLSQLMAQEDYNDQQMFMPAMQQPMQQPMAFGQQLQQQPGMFGNIGLDQIGAGAGILKDLYGLYSAHQGMGLAKDQLGMQKQAFADNKANRDRIVNASKSAFA